MKDFIDAEEYGNHIHLVTPQPDEVAESVEQVGTLPGVDLDGRNQQVVGNLALAVSIANLYRNKGEPIEDVRQAGMVGLVHAADRFDPDRGLQFSTFAVPTIKGEIQKHFRDRCSPIHIVRRVREEIGALNNAETSLAQQLGRMPSQTEIARHMGKTEAEVQEISDARDYSRPGSLGVPSRGRDGEMDTTVADTIYDPSADFEDQSADKIMIDQLIATLRHPEQKEVIRLYFFEGFSQEAIASKMGCSQMHISRVLKRAIKNMRAAAEQD